MNTTHYHPTADLMLQYSAGTATLSQALCVATHMEFCQSCRQTHQRNNAIGGSLIEALNGSSQIAVDANLKSKVLGMLDQTGSGPDADANPPTDKTSTAAKHLPRALRRLIPKGFEALDWQLVSATARSCQLYQDDDGATVSLLKLKPGSMKLLVDL